MKLFSKEHFQKAVFTPAQIEHLLENARRDMRIAEQDSFTEVRFAYCYQALLKAGIALIAKEKGLKVRSIPGHHIQVLKGLADLLGNRDIEVVGNAMRMKRNMDLYGGGQFFSDKETRDHLEFVANIVKIVLERCA